MKILRFVKLLVRAEIDYFWECVDEIDREQTKYAGKWWVFKFLRLCVWCFLIFMLFVYWAGGAKWGLW